MLARQRGGDINLSRVDSMIAVRMRVTGYSRDDIEGALRLCAPMIRSADQQNDHKWDDYAQRTADYAFSPRGDRQASDLAKYREQWLTLEGRASAGQPVELALAHDDDDDWHSPR